MNNTARKQNIKLIPTELNYFYNTNKRINRLKKQGNTSKLLIITLIIWNIILSCQFIPAPAIIPQFTDKQNEQIMMLEEIPMEVLEVE
jgi:hypothetical protein